MRSSVIALPIHHKGWGALFPPQSAATFTALSTSGPERKVFMRRFLVALMTTALIASEAQAADWRIQSSDMRTGTFAGARLKLSLGDRADAKPHAQLTIAPTRSSISTTGFIRTRIGEGAALDLQASRKPVLTIAGIRADTAFGLQRGRGTTSERKLGVSTGAAVAIGVGVVAIAGAAYFLYLLNEAEKNSE